MALRDEPLRLRRKLAGRIKSYEVECSSPVSVHGSYLSEAEIDWNGEIDIEGSP